jgi:hypothetical protein
MELCQLGCFGDAAGPNAGGANTNVHAYAIHYGADALEIWIPAAAARVVRVTDHVAERRALAADFASHSHDNSSAILTMLNKASSLAESLPIRTRFDGLIVAQFGSRRRERLPAQETGGRSVHGEPSHGFRGGTGIFIATHEVPW